MNPRWKPLIFLTFLLRQDRKVHFQSDVAQNCYRRNIQLVVVDEKFITDVFFCTRKSQIKISRSRPRD